MVRNFRIFHNSFVWEVLRESVNISNISENILSISEKSNSYKNYEKNFTKES